jgi:hypothetical protein
LAAIDEVAVLCEEHVPQRQTADQHVVESIVVGVAHATHAVSTKRPRRAEDSEALRGLQRQKYCGKTTRLAEDHIRSSCEQITTSHRAHNHVIESIAIHITRAANRHAQVIFLRSSIYRKALSGCQSIQENVRVTESLPENDVGSSDVRHPAVAPIGSADYDVIETIAVDIARAAHHPSRQIG